MKTDKQTATQKARYSRIDRWVMAWVIVAVYSPFVLLIGAGATVV